VVGYEENLPVAWIKVGTTKYEKYREKHVDESVPFGASY